MKTNDSNKENGITEGTSFIGLQSYTEAHSDKFFGRDEEIRTLSKLVRLNTLTIVFGKSGTGKTSLLNAGVFPNLRENYCLPFRIRLEFREDSPDLITQIKNTLKQEIDMYGFKVESYPGNETLWEYFHKEPLWKAITPILIFDQFEEIFTLARNNPRFVLEELPAFWEELSDIIENSIPETLKERFLDKTEKVPYNYKKQKTKVVFAFREEYLPEFESVTSKIPSLKTSRFRLMPMNGNQAYEVITKTWKEHIQPTEARQIVSYLTNEDNPDLYSLITVEPSLLSQVCTYIDKERIDKGYENVSSELLKKYPQSTILRSIYEESLSAAGAALMLPGLEKVKDPYNPVKEFLEEKLITQDGYRTKYNLQGLDEPLKPGIDVLKSKYFIREDEKSVELTHDVLAPLIKVDRIKRRKDVANKAEQKKARRRALLILGIALLSAFAFWFYAKMERDKVKKESALLKAELAINDSILAMKKDSINNFIDSIKKYIHIYKGKTDTIIIPAPEDVKKVEELVKQLDDLNDRHARLKLENDKKALRLSELQNQPMPVFDMPPPLYSQPNPGVNYSEKMDSLLQLNDQIKKENQDYRIQIRQLRLRIDSLLKVLGNETGKIGLQGRLYYDREGNDLVKPADVTLYLIPKNRKNYRIIKNASVYEISCYEKELREAEGVVTARTDKNGHYKFRNLPNGVDEFFLKICTYYGGYYTVNLKQVSGTLNLNASPPIRYPVAN